MENAGYNRLIINNKLEELANIWNVSELTEYKYLKRYLLEYLLEKNIHTKMMDNYAVKNKLWINLYIKYNVLDPLTNIPLESLLVLKKNELLLESLLKKLNYDQKIALYNQFKTNSYWLLRLNESLIISLYSKYGVNLDNVFMRLPLISDQKIVVNEKVQALLDEFILTFNDTNQNILEMYVNEFKRMSKIDVNRTCIDILKLITYKQKHQHFKLTICGYTKNKKITGEYDPEGKKIIIDEYRKGIFSHELSHMLYDEYEENASNIAYAKYRNIQEKICKSKKIKNIISYLNEFHKRYNAMEDLMNELYYAQIKKQYGNYSKYIERIRQDILKYKIDKITIDEDLEDIYLVDDEDITDAIEELIWEESIKYSDILIRNYYTEELMLENLLDALFKGRIFEGKDNIYCLSGHSKKYFKLENDLSFNEVLANYDAIKKSRKADVLINKLRNLVGDELIIFLDEYINNNRNSKKHIKIK